MREKKICSLLVSSLFLLLITPDFSWLSVVQLKNYISLSSVLWINCDWELSVMWNFQEMSSKLVRFPFLVPVLFLGMWTWWLEPKWACCDLRQHTKCGSVTGSYKIALDCLHVLLNENKCLSCHLSLVVLSPLLLYVTELNADILEDLTVKAHTYPHSHAHSHSCATLLRLTCVGDAREPLQFWQWLKFTKCLCYSNCHQLTPVTDVFLDLVFWRRGELPLNLSPNIVFSKSLKYVFRK